jgi:hypothetical protein
MCAINPTHKKRFVFDVYTSDTKMNKETFEDLVIGTLLAVEMKLNSDIPRFRFHLKESNQPAD